MAYDPTQQTPQPGGYPQQPYQQYPPTQQGYPPTQQGYPPSQPVYQSQPQPNYAQYTGSQPQAPYGAPVAAGAGFDFSAFMKKLALPGQVAAVCGLLLFISFFLNWYGVSYLGYSFNLTGSFIANNATFPAFLMWLVPLAGLALIALPITGALGKMPAKTVNMGVLGAAGAALLGEIIFLIKSSDAGTSSAGTTSLTGLSYGPSFGFYLAVLTTLAAGGVYLYFNFLKKPATPGMMGMPLAGQPPYQQPGSQPYGQPYQQPGSQPYPPQYPPQYPGQPPQYPQQ